MCFSATASFAAGIGLTGLGLVTVWRVPEPRQRPFAALPLLFGLQQLTEGALWLALQSGGTLHIESAPGRGTTAEIFLPKGGSRHDDPVR